MDDHATNVYVAALRYASVGYHLYPVTLGLKANGKKKVTVHVKSWTEASTTNTAQIIAWFGPGAPYAGTGIGIDCEKSGIAVVDLDEGVAEGGRVKAGIANWNELIEQHGGAEWEPFRVQTRSGGGHLYFRQRTDAPVFNDSTGKLAGDVDTRGVGGTVFAAPTRIQSTDQAYRWLADLLPVADLPLIPAWVPERMDQADRAEEAEAIGARTASGRAPVTAGDAHGRMLQHCDVIRAEPVGSGNGNTTVYKAACKVGQYVGAGQIGHAEAHAALTAAVDSWRYTDRDLYKTIDRGLQWGQARPRVWGEAMAVPPLLPIPRTAVPAPQAPQPAQHAPVALDDAHAVFRRWLGPEYDMDALNATLATAAVERLDGDPLWLLVISGSGNAKTETVQALAGGGATVTSTISSDGALLSASPRKDRGKDATGGLLRKMGDRGVLVIKDVTSILSANRDTRATVLAAMREVYDGH